jgi:DNA topoisomerase I
MNLIIVESPTKANTLSKFLGKDYDVLATKGHIKDLPKSELGIDVEKNFKPSYVAVEKKKEEVANIQKAGKTAKKIYIATDPDREGEAIASHVEEFLLERKDNKDKLSRIVFHEITKEAVEEALAAPRDVDKNLVDAQVGRRVLDRLVGYKLSPLLWRKVRRGLSAGRVQTVAVRLIVEREREIEKFKKDEYWEIFSLVKGKKNGEFQIYLSKIEDKKADVKDGKTANSIVKDLEKADYKVYEVAKRQVTKKPYPPYTTSTMTQAAARLLGWSAKKTMNIAQQLYEEGLITYHRTDSLFVAKSAVLKLRSFIKEKYGEKYLSGEERYYKTTSKVAQEAHEAIRPTNVAKEKDADGLAKDKSTLYGLIARRFVATQMAESLYDETVIDVEAKGDKIYLLRASGQVMRFDGWKILFKNGEEGEVSLPEVEKDEVLKLIKTWGEQKFTQPPVRFNEASLIKTLEKLGIGRPSTYAPIISTIQLRNYVEKDEGKFKPTPVGIAVNDFLLTNFPDVFEYAFTAEMENDLDQVANGVMDWEETIKYFWKPFGKKLETVGKAKRVKIETEKLGKKCPECKTGELVIRIGRFGKFISCSRFPECKFTDRFIEKINMKCPDCKKGEVIIKKTKKGRKFFGCSRYPECTWASWRKPETDTTDSASK